MRGPACSNTGIADAPPHLPPKLWEAVKSKQSEEEQTKTFSYHFTSALKFIFFSLGMQLFCSTWKRATSRGRSGDLAAFAIASLSKESVAIFSLSLRGFPSGIRGNLKEFSHPLTMTKSISSHFSKNTLKFKKNHFTGG
jgi:hypothetical protein